MERIFFVADTHFGDEDILQYEARPFLNVDEMDECMIGSWNTIVEPSDTVFHLGDFCVDGKEAEYLSKLNGNVYLIKGNHDCNSNDYYRNAGFKEVYDMPIIFNQFWILSHEPIYITNNMPYANFFGHVHSNPQYKTLSKHHFCVCVERIGYIPIDFTQMKRRMAKEGQ